MTDIAHDAPKAASRLSVTISGLATALALVTAYLASHPTMLGLPETGGGIGSVWDNVWFYGPDTVLDVLALSALVLSIVGLVSAAVAVARGSGTATLSAAIRSQALPIALSVVAVAITLLLLASRGSA